MIQNLNLGVYFNCQFCHFCQFYNRREGEWLCLLRSVYQVSFNIRLYIMPPKRKPINKDFNINSLGLPFDVSKLSEDGRLIVSIMIMMFSMKTNNNKFYEELAAKQNQITSLTENTRTPAFGGISLALRGNGASGAAFRAPSAPRLGCMGRPFCDAFGGGKRIEKKKLGRPWRPI